MPKESGNIHVETEAHKDGSREASSQTLMVIRWE